MIIRKKKSFYIFVMTTKTALQNILLFSENKKRTVCTRSSRIKTVLSDIINHLLDMFTSLSSALQNNLLTP